MCQVYYKQSQFKQMHSIICYYVLELLFRCVAAFLEMDEILGQPMSMDFDLPAESDTVTSVSTGKVVKGFS